MSCCHRKFSEGAVCKSPEGAGGGGEFSPHSSNPPCNTWPRESRECFFRRNYSTGYGGGGPEKFRISPQMGSNIDWILSALRSFVEDGGVSLRVEIEGFSKLIQSSMINAGMSIKSPVEGVDLKFGVGNGSPSFSSQKQDNTHGLNISDTVRIHIHWQRSDEIVGGEPAVSIAPGTGDINANT